MRFFSIPPKLRLFFPLSLIITVVVIVMTIFFVNQSIGIVGAFIICLVSILLLLGFIYYFTAGRIERFITELQNSRKKLDTVSRALEESEERRMEWERKILSAVIKGEERERQRFAREMHDGLGPLLSTIKLYVNELNSITLEEDEKKDLITHSNELIDEAVNATRTISNNLMPTVIHSYGLLKAVQAFCDKVNKVNQLNIQFETKNIHDRLESNLEIIFFRVISELINNTIKHARAKNIFILLVKEQDKLSLYFKDDGIGFDVDEIIDAENKGMGLKNIISRIKSINGKYSFSSIPGEGFTIQIEINL